ncbi:4-hydroxybenzoate octaprenyltransferase [Polymorphobacter multimanifer]|uniref:4-hydroxybenzoate octaprenyltransferase n=1 Tax=Polymorphobacter multimanifer TaxID=1070431 RepID=A0A841L546_9SPHN|nr:4-hydroxybenzoate octaprenyltransferase [Polymorphobacter multimanifer]MBB6226093.1 4-hydroxybenzoate polyprenyltransferase [Polymorphobacter multimanifer]GGI76240.1 4-hydroxybenzoate octaprenyltransferase [Polymorphobacter multimanifer]
MASTAPRPNEPATPDAEVSGWLRLLPAGAQAYARLARLDRPAGSWLLFWPCAAGVALAGGLVADWALIPWFLLGSLAMRAAGCVWNDIIDRDLDAKVERTRARPVASGAIGVRAALAFAVALSLIGLLVVLQLRPLAQLVAIASLVLVAAYPFMKRITWWPQAWLGLTFNWGVLVGWTAITAPGWPMALLYAAGIFWTLGYDTIYALQDLEDDAMAGIKSSARALGARARTGVAGFYGLSVAALVAALWLALPDPLSPLAALPFALHCLWQVWALKDHAPARALALFRANRQAGLLLFAACAVVGLA